MEDAYGPNSVRCMWMELGLLGILHGMIEFCIGYSPDLESGEMPPP